MAYRGVSASAVFTFDERGRFTWLTALRYKDPAPDAKLERWIVQATEHARMRDFYIPVQGDVIWDLENGRIDAYHWTVEDIGYDQPARYE